MSHPNFFAVAFAAHLAASLLAGWGVWWLAWCAWAAPTRTRPATTLPTRRGTGGAEANESCLGKFRDNSYFVCIK